MSDLVVTREFTPSMQRFMSILSHNMRSQGDRWFGICATVIFLSFLAWYVIGIFNTGDVHALKGIVLGLVAAAVGWVVLFWALPRAVQKYSVNKSGFTRRRYTFGVDTLLLETVDGVTLKAPYRTFAKISLGPDYLLFWESFPGSAAHMIPCEEFESRDHERIVRNWLAAFATA